MTVNSSDRLHDADLALWCERESALLRAGRVGELDADHIAGELGDLLTVEDRLLREHIRALLSALLLWAYDADLRSHARLVDVSRLRDAVGRLVEASPSQRPTLPSIIAEEYDAARHDAEIRMGWLLDDTLPAGCPFTLDEVFEQDRLPDPLGVDRDRGADWWKTR